MKIVSSPIIEYTARKQIIKDYKKVTEISQVLYGMGLGLQELKSYRDKHGRVIYTIEVVEINDRSN